MIVIIRSKPVPERPHNEQVLPDILRRPVRSLAAAASPRRARIPLELAKPAKGSYLTHRGAPFAAYRQLQRVGGS